jgi:hypothetical protein
MEKKANAADDAAFTELLNRGLAEMTKPVDPCALENAVAANSALMELLFDHMQLEGCSGQTSGFGGTGPESGTLLNGVLHLVWMCRERLNKASGLMPVCVKEMAS